jgi:hypothetical protein
VDVHIEQRQGEEYSPQKLPSRPFGGSGNRLGAPVPDVAAGSSSVSPAAASSAASAPSGGSDRASMTTRFEVDQSKPTTSVQIRLADGTR